MGHVHIRWLTRIGLVLVAVALALGVGGTGAQAFQGPSKWLIIDP